MEPIGINGDVAGTLDASYFKGCGERQGTEREVVCQPVGYEMQAFGKYKDSGIASALKARDYKDATDLVVAGVDCRNATEYEEQTGALQSSACHNMNNNNVVRTKHIVRRLTPLECERLQGYPDGWTDIGEWADSKGKKHKEADSPRYKALGNSIALPPWKWVLKRLCACYERDATMASLFDGIGGFPLIWEQLNGKGSCLWASEIEEFPMAVTKLRFGG
jgi:DNA (cytosine-5)-methyltransferase 1